MAFVLYLKEYEPDYRPSAFAETKRLVTGHVSLGRGCCSATLSAAGRDGLFRWPLGTRSHEHPGLVNQGPWILSGEQRSKTFHEKSLEHVPGYSYGAAEVARSAVSVLDLENLKTSAGFTEEDQRYLRLAGEVLADQTKQIVNHWRGGIIATIPNSPDTLGRPRETLSRNTSRPAIPVFRNGFWTPACGPTIRSGSTTNRKLRCGISP